MRGVITLTEKFFNQDYADSLKNIVSNTLPAGATLSEQMFDAGTHAGELMGSVLLEGEGGQAQASTEERALALSALQEGGFISYREGAILPAKVAVLVLGDSDTAQFEDEFAAAFDSRGSGLVVAGRIHTAADTGAIGLIRADASKRRQLQPWIRSIKAGRGSLWCVALPTRWRVPRVPTVPQAMLTPQVLPCSDYVRLCGAQQ